LEHQKSEFLQLASHELRAPITLVSGYLSMLEDGSLGALPEAAAKVVPLMTGRMRQMSALVDRLLTTSRLELRARDHKMQDIELDPVLRAVAASAGATANGPSRQITVQSTGDVQLRADPEQVETILTNLVSNAVKYSPTWTEVVVSVREEPRWVLIDVSDRGDGIAEEDLSKLFRPFGRLPKAVAAGIHGTGLGLHLSRSLALAQGGDPRVVYDGTFEIKGERADLCLARLWPDFAALGAQPDFADCSMALYGPLADWLEQHITIAVIGGEEAA